MCAYMYLFVYIFPKIWNKIPFSINDKKEKASLISRQAMAFPSVHRHSSMCAAYELSPASLHLGFERLLF